MPVFWANLSGEMVFYLLGKKRILFRLKKLSFKNVQKNRDSPNELVHCFCQKMKVFMIFVFWANQATKNRGFFN